MRENKLHFVVPCFDDPKIKRLTFRPSSNAAAKLQSIIFIRDFDCFYCWLFLMLLLLLLSVVCCFVNGIHWHYYCVAIVHSRLSSFTDKIHTKAHCSWNKVQKKDQTFLKVDIRSVLWWYGKKTHSFSVGAVSVVGYFVICNSLRFILSFAWALSAETNFQSGSPCVGHMKSLTHDKNANNIDN